MNSRVDRFYHPMDSTHTSSLRLTTGWAPLLLALAGFILLRLPLSASQPLPRSTPEAEGVSSAAIEAFVEAADRQLHEMHSFMLVRHGKVVAEGWWKPHSATEPHAMFSLSKSFTSTAIGLATAEGKLQLDDPILKFFPDEAPADPSPNLKAMRIRDLLTLTTGHERELKLPRNRAMIKAFLAQPVDHAPGTFWMYDSCSVFVLSAIIQKVTGQTMFDYLRPRIFEPLGIEHATWKQSKDGITIGDSELKICTEDVAKFGQLYLQKGQWNGHQLIPAAWAKAATTKQVRNDTGVPRNDPDSRQGYGYLFWMTRHGAYRASGSDGQFSLVMPEQDAVVAITSTDDGLTWSEPRDVAPVLAEADAALAERVWAGTAGPQFTRENYPL